MQKSVEVPMSLEILQEALGTADHEMARIHIRQAMQYELATRDSITTP